MKLLQVSSSVLLILYDHRSLKQKNRAGNRKEDKGGYGKVLTSKANPRAAREGQIRPIHLTPFPSFRSELVGVLAPDILAPMHAIHTKSYHLSFPDSHRFGAILPPTDGQRSVPDGLASVARDRRVEAESLLNGIL